MPDALKSRDAKEFLVGEIVAEGERENVVLSDIERKMLYFSETAWSLPDICEVNEAFERSMIQVRMKRRSPASSRIAFSI